MTPLYAIGDIHGQKAMLDAALALIAADGGDDATVYFLGDYTDRGPDSRGVLDTLTAGQAAGRNWHFIKGNHDRMFTRFVREGIHHDNRIMSGLSWLNPRLGGPQTLASYGVTGEVTMAPHTRGDPEQFAGFTTTDGRQLDLAGLQQAARDAVPEAHLAFIDALPLFLTTDDLVFVHAGLRPDVALADQDTEDLLWIRDGFLETGHDFGRLVVHGHTALDHPQHFGNRVDLDGGAGYFRPLVPAVFEGRDCWTLTPKGRAPLLL